MKFFVPDTADSLSEATYKALFTSAREQLRTSITPKRIYRLEYIHDKHQIAVQVGGTHPDHPHYTIVAILESQPHIVMTRTSAGQPGPTIMIASHEVTEVVEFAE